MPSSLTLLIAEKYPTVAKDLLAPLVDLLSLSRSYCDGDLDKFLILTVIALRTTAHKDFAGFSQEQLLDGTVPIFPTLGINVRSIAASTGIPNETVRRKVAELIRKGWIVRRGHHLYFTSVAYQALAPVREQIEALAVRYFHLVAALQAPAA